jgi:manganese efflux pump family protein
MTADAPPSFSHVAALLLVALSVGLDNFGAATALGVGGVDPSLRIRVALVFGLFEGAMPVAGLLVGHSLARYLGSAATPVAGATLALAGGYAIASPFVGTKRTSPRDPHPSSLRLVIIGAALSIDNAVVGFALGTYHVNLLLAAVVISVISVVLSLLGLEIGSRLGDRLGKRSELVGGVMLVLVGVAVGSGLL